MTAGTLPLYRLTVSGPNGTDVMPSRQVDGPLSWSEVRRAYHAAVRDTLTVGGQDWAAKTIYHVVPA